MDSRYMAYPKHRKNLCLASNIRRKDHRLNETLHRLPATIG